MRPSATRAGFTAWVDHLAREHTESLVATAVREGLGGEQAVEAVLEAFATYLGLPQARRLTEHREDAGALLAVLVRCAARTQRRHPARPRPAVSEVAVDDSPSVATLVAAAEQHVLWLGCAAKLAEAQRAVLALRALEEIGDGEAGRQLGLAPGQLAALFSRARQALQLCLAD